jgi:hypothetical protein
MNNVEKNVLVMMLLGIGLFIVGDDSLMILYKIMVVVGAMELRFGRYLDNEA